MDNTSPEEFPSWQDLEEIGAGDGVPTECERCGKPGTPRQQFEHMGMTICYICADERVDVAYTTAQRAINRLEALGAVSRVGDDRRNRVYCSQAILDVLEEFP